MPSLLIAKIRDYAFPIRYIFVPHVGQTPLVAGLPFDMVTALHLDISFFDLHFMQYASILVSSYVFTLVT
jgi:hypothetical protein